jgi:hypothetical protein
MSWELNIEKAQNGFVCWWEDENDAGDTIQQRNVIEEPDTEDGELEGMEKLLSFIKEHFGVRYSKHNKKNLIIKIEGENDSKQ